MPKWNQADIAVADGLAGTVRAGEWWDHKLVPILTAFYATALLLGAPVAALWPHALALLVAMLAGAAFVSVLNDLADIDDDRAAGKPNRMAGRSRAFRAAALALPVAVGLLFGFLWRDTPMLAGAYALAWLAFAAYSLPPLRLKVRGFAGLVADASGAHFFPTLVAILLAFRAAGAPPDPSWLAAGAAWALGYGLRGILWHQLADRERDRRAGVPTFAERHPPIVAARVAALGAFPLELAGLGALLWRLAEPLPLLLLALYLVMTLLRLRLWRMNAVVAAPAPRGFILLHEYYDALLPIAVLAASALVHPIDFVVLAAHLLLFGRRPLEVARTGLLLAAGVARRVVQSR